MKTDDPLPLLLLLLFPQNHRLSPGPHVCQASTLQLSSIPNSFTFLFSDSVFLGLELSILLPPPRWLGLQASLAIPRVLILVGIHHMKPHWWRGEDKLALPAGALKQGCPCCLPAEGVAPASPVPLALQLCYYPRRLTGYQCAPGAAGERMKNEGFLKRK